MDPLELCMGIEHKIELLFGVDEFTLFNIKLFDEMYIFRMVNKLIQIVDFKSFEVDTTEILSLNPSISIQVDVPNIVKSYNVFVNVYVLSRLL